MLLSVVSAGIALLFIAFTTKQIEGRGLCRQHALILAVVELILAVGALAAIYNLAGLSVALTTIIIGVAVLDVVLAALTFKMRNTIKQGCNSKSKWWPLILVSVLMLAACIVHFGTRFSLIYIDIDSARYLKLAMEIRRTKSVSGEFLSPLIVSLFIQWIEPFVRPVSLYKGMILAHICIQVISACMFWCLAHKLNGGRYPEILTVALTILYVGGFQMYILTYGTFFHLEDGILILMFLIYHLLELQQHTEPVGMGVVAFALGILGLLICYPFFIAIAGVLFLPEIVIWIKKHAKKFNVKGKVGILALACVIGGIGGYFMRQRSASLAGILDNLKTEGVTYREPYADFLFFIPIFIAYTIFLYKNRKETESTKSYTIWRMNVVAFLFMLVWFGLYAKGYLSTYYYYRNYYVMWLLAWLMVAHAIGILKESQQAVMLASYGVLYAIAVITSVSGINSRLEQVNSSMFFDGKADRVFCPLYEFTANELKNRAEPAVSPEMFELYDFVIEELGQEDVPMLTSYYSVMRSAWYHAITDIDHSNATCDLRKETVYEMLEKLDSYKIKYVIYQKNDKQWQKYQNNVLSGFEVIKENDEGAILALTDGTWCERINLFESIDKEQQQIIDFAIHDVAPQNVHVLTDKNALDEQLAAYTAYFGENADEFVGTITAKNLLKKLKLLDEANADAVIILKNSKIYMQNEDYWREQNIVFENEVGLLVGPAGSSWVSSNQK